MEERHIHEIYAIVNSLSANWPEFITLKLGLQPYQYDDLQQVHRGNPQYMRYQTVLLWMNGLHGSNTDEKINLLKQKKIEFFSGHTSTPHAAQSLQRSDDVGELKLSTPKQYEEHLRSIESGDRTIYPIRSDRAKGKVLIINNMFEGTPGMRDGSEHDVASMESLWKNIGCMVTKSNDLTAKEMAGTVEDFAGMVRNVSLCVVIVMTHGDAKDGKSILCGNNATPETKNERHVSVDDLLQKFNSASQHLQGIPKLIIFQACRGQEVGPKSDDIPPADMYVAYPTKQDFKAWRSHDGSWFIKAIKRVFNEKAHNTDVATMFEEVKAQIHDTYTYEEKQEVDTESSFGGRKLFLYPGWPKIN